MSTLLIQLATATSYVAVCWNASAASRCRCGEREAARSDGGEHVGVPRRGLVTMATEGWFLAAARTIDGPPMSICSTHSSGVAPESDGLAERVEVGDHEVERLDAQLVELLDVGLQAAVGEDAGVHLRVQRLDPAVEALREAGQLLDLGDRDAEPLDQRGRAAGRDQRHARLVQAAGELFEPGLVVDRDQRPRDRDPVSLSAKADLPVLDGEALGAPSRRPCRRAVLARRP